MEDHRLCITQYKILRVPVFGSRCLKQDEKYPLLNDSFLSYVYTRIILGGREKKKRMKFPTHIIFEQMIRVPPSLRRDLNTFRTLCSNPYVNVIFTFFTFLQNDQSDEWELGSSDGISITLSKR